MIRVPSGNEVRFRVVRTYDQRVLLGGTRQWRLSRWERLLIYFGLMRDPRRGYTLIYERRRR